MKILKTLIALAVMLMIAIVMAQTTPGKERHKEAMMKAVREFVDDEAQSRGFGDNALTKLGKDVVVAAAEVALNSKLKMHDYYVVNTTYVRLRGEEQMLSLGILGMVFTFDKEMLHEKLQQALEVKEEALTEKEAARQGSKELKQLEKEKRKIEKQQEKERKRQEKQALKEQKRRDKEAQKEQKHREKEARHEG